MSTKCHLCLPNIPPYLTLLQTLPSCPAQSGSLDCLLQDIYIYINKYVYIYMEQNAERGREEGRWWEQAHQRVQTPKPALDASFAGIVGVVDSRNMHYLTDISCIYGQPKLKLFCTSPSQLAMCLGYAHKHANQPVQTTLSLALSLSDIANLLFASAFALVNCRSLEDPI